MPSALVKTQGRCCRCILRCRARHDGSKQGRDSCIHERPSTGVNLCGLRGDLVFPERLILQTDARADIDAVEAAHASIKIEPLRVGLNATGLADFFAEFTFCARLFVDDDLEKRHPGKDREKRPGGTEAVAEQTTVIV